MLFVIFLSMIPPYMITLITQKEYSLNIKLPGKFKVTKYVLMLTTQRKMITIPRVNNSTKHH